MCLNEKITALFHLAKTLICAQRCLNMTCGNCYTQVSQNGQTTLENTDVR